LSATTLYARRIGTIFGMLSRRAGLSATAGLSCFIADANVRSHRAVNYGSHCDCQEQRGHHKLFGC